MRLPTFSRQSDDHTPDSSTSAATPAPAGPAPAASTTPSTAPPASATPVGERRDAPAVPSDDRAEPTTLSMPPVSDTPPVPAQRSATAAATERVKAEHAGESARSERAAAERAADEAKVDRIKAGHDASAPPAVVVDRGPTPAPVVAGPKPRASLLATLGLITGVASAMLVLSGPLVGYGIGLAVLALVLSVAGIRATARRHVAGKSDALIGMALALGAIVVGVLALTGSISWLGTDTQPVSNLREWLDAQFTNRF